MLKRPTDRSRVAIQSMARIAVENNGGPSLARVWFKYTCGGCGSRETAPTPNVLPEDAVCTVCNGRTKITGAGFALEKRKDRFFDWDNPPEGSKTLLIRKQYASDKGDA